MEVYKVIKVKRQKRTSVAACAEFRPEQKFKEGSIENQIEHYEELIKSNPDYEFVNIL